MDVDDLLKFMKKRFTMLKNSNNNKVQITTLSLLYPKFHQYFGRLELLVENPIQFPLRSLRLGDAHARPQQHDTACDSAQQPRLTAPKPRIHANLPPRTHREF